MCGIELGIGNAIEAVGSDIRGNGDNARFGVTIDMIPTGTEVGIDGSRPVKDIVRDIQEIAIRMVSEGCEDGNRDEMAVRMRGCNRCCMDRLAESEAMIAEYLE